MILSCSTMGNYLSRNCGCQYITAWPLVGIDSKQKKQLDRTIIVLHPAEKGVLELGDGAPMTVAEVMLDFPGHFLLEYLPASPLHSKRTIALPADQEASLGCVYVLLPMHRLHAHISPQESALWGSFLSSSLLHRHRRLPSAECSLRRKRSLHSLVQASSAKVAPLSGSSLPQQQHVQEKTMPQLQALHPLQDVDGSCHRDVDDDLYLSQFSSDRPAGGSFLSRSHSLVRSKSWMPRLQTIDECSSPATSVKIPSVLYTKRRRKDLAGA